MKSSVLGGGSWGTALAAVLAEKGPVRQWARDPAVVEGINRNHRNPHYQSDLVLPENISATNSIQSALVDSDLVCVVVPSHAMRSVMAEAAPFLRVGSPIVSASKGIENETLMTMEEVISEVIDLSIWSIVRP